MSTNKVISSGDLIEYATFGRQEKGVYPNVCIGQYMAFDGRAPRTKQTHPYSYDPFDIYKADFEHTGGFYTDRLLQGDFAKHDKLCKKHFGDAGQIWSSRKFAKIQDFCRDWTGDKKIRLVLVREYCNQSSGFPTWYLGWHTPKAEG